MGADVKTVELKKTQATTAGTAKDTQANAKSVENFFSEVKQELKRITWTTPEELKTYTKIVVGATFCFGMGIYVMDLAIQLGLSVLEYGIRLISG